MRHEGSLGQDADVGALALRAAWAGAAAIAAVRARGAVEADYKTGGHDLVTAADRAAEAAVIDTIEAARPHDAIVGEEGGARAGTSGLRWLVDPIDGTANFFHGRSDYAVSVAAEAEGRVAVGAIVRPSDGRWAMAAGGTLTSGQDPPPPAAAGDQEGEATDTIRARLDLHRRTAEALVSFGLPYSMTGRQQAFSLMRGVVPLVRAIRLIGSAACDLLAVAHGESDAFVGCGLAEWDTAAGEAVVAAAGGEVRRLMAPGFGVLLAGSPPVVYDLGEFIAALGADRDDGP
jgi:myo-inositol-1(or 4)-monophosphatase